MTATETYYQNKIKDLEDEVALARFERDALGSQLKKWEINATDVGWKGEHQSTFLRNLARDSADIPMFQQIIKDLSESVERLSRTLTEVASK